MSASLLRGLTNKDVKKYVRALVSDHGFHLEPRRPGVHTLVCPDGKKVPLHTTHASNNAARHLCQKLRHKGYDVPNP